MVPHCGFKVTVHRPHLRRGELCSTSLKTEFFPGGASGKGIMEHTGASEIVNTGFAVRGLVGILTAN